MYRLSVVIPAYNEESRIEKALRSAAEFVAGLDFAAEIVVVDDGSRDDTSGIVERVSAELPAIRIVCHETNRGKGMAVRTGVLAAKGEWALFSDVDEAVPIQEALLLLAAGEEQGADVVIGTRYHRESRILRRQPWPRVLVSRVGNLLIRALVLPGLRDTQCGFKLLRTRTLRPVLERATIRGFGFDIEVLAIARLWGRRIVEVPVTWVHGDESTLHLRRAALDVLRDLLRVAWRVRSGFYGREPGPEAVDEA
jgi:dolichyl-phosphate beta-glucosyltransferase